MTDPANKSAGSPPTGDQPHVASAPEPRRITEFDADQPQHAAAPVGFAALLGVLGVVYGDIGTSPLYAFRSTVEVISGHHQVAPWEILGVASLIFWTLILIVTVKYVILIMRADHNGEGGILAIMSLAQRVVINQKTRWILGLVGIVGACLFFGDGIITPAISVLSAIEGVEVSVPAAHDFVIPVAILVIISLFSVQWIGRQGRHHIWANHAVVVWHIGCAGADGNSASPSYSHGAFTHLCAGIHLLPRQAFLSGARLRRIVRYRGGSSVC